MWLRSFYFDDARETMFSVILLCLCAPVFTGASPVGGFEKQADKFLTDMAKAGVTITTVEKAFDDGTAAMLATLVPKEEAKEVSPSPIIAGFLLIVYRNIIELASE